MALPRCAECLRGFSIAKTDYEVNMIQIVTSLALFILLGVSTWWLLLGQDRYIRQRKEKRVRKTKHSKFANRKSTATTKNNCRKQRKSSSSSSTSSLSSYASPPKVIRIKETEEDICFSSDSSSADDEASPSDNETTTVDTTHNDRKIVSADDRLADNFVKPARRSRKKKSKAKATTTLSDPEEKKKSSSTCIGFDNTSNDTPVVVKEPEVALLPYTSPEQEQQQKQHICSPQKIQEILIYSILNTAEMTGDDALIVCRQLEQLTEVHRATINLVTSKLTVRRMCYEGDDDDDCIANVLEHLHIQVTRDYVNKKEDMKTSVNNITTAALSFSIGPIQPPAPKAAAAAFSPWNTTIGPIQSPTTSRRATAECPHPPPGFASQGANQQLVNENPWAPFP
mmetsp:Transcript_28171/g.41614  ORF Transcript_28171/g.41614 Transcript_28171/m.41614 type:complete len:397 (-) Transcript_28171:360-1550(-)